MVSAKVAQIGQRETKNMRSLNAWWDECKQERMTQTISAGFIKWESIHVCEASHHNSDCSWKICVMYATGAKYEQKLKRCFYKLTYIKMTASIHWNQVDITHMKWSTKSDRNISWDMRSELTPKQMSWMCRWLLDLMWDVRVARSRWGLRSTTSGWCVFIKLMLRHACHKSRKSDTWREVYEMILPCNIQLLKIDP